MFVFINNLNGEVFICSKEFGKKLNVKFNIAKD